MPTPTSRTRWAGVVAAGALALATTTAAAPALASGAGVALPAGSSGLAGLAGSSEVTMFLKAPHPAALAALAATPVVNGRAARIAALAKLVPSSAAHRSLVSHLQAEGLSIVSQTAWSVTAVAPTTLVSTLFGALPTTLEAATAGMRTPASLTSLVSGVFPTTAGPAVFSPHATSTLAGADFRAADTPARVKPSTGTKDAGVTVATLQLAPFTASDLTTYATDNKLADPVADGNYQPVTVDGGPGTTDAISGGAVEVALDQESILSTAPTAHQHPYFAPNTDAGFIDVFANVYDDVVGNSMATAKDPHLTAMSSSWGECEGAYTAKSINALEPVMESVVAAGVTIFASSGDDGIYDCGSTSGTGTDDTQSDVDFPASSPYVISAGGSNLAAPTSAANTGTNWVEKVWSCTSPSSCENTTTGTGGGGGGESGSSYGVVANGATVASNFKGFAMPVWQRRTLTGVYAKQKNRLVPDISADADPETGFSVYCTDPTFLVETLGGTGTVGGTSLASPISAAQLTNTLADAGRTHGVGDIHGAIYSAYARTRQYAATSKLRAFRDVTHGTNGATATKGKDPSVSAVKGFDTASGLGGVLWSALDPYLLDTAAPKPVGTFFLRHQNRAGAKVVAVARWKAKRGSDTDVFDTTYASIRKVGSTKPLKKATVGTSGKFVFKATRGARYTITVIATDIAGHVSKHVVTTVRIPSSKRHHSAR